MTATFSTFPLLVTIDCPARVGRPARTFQHRVVEPLTDEQRSQFERLTAPVVDDLLDRHPNWTRQMAQLGVIGMLLEHLDDVEAYERVARARGVRPL